MRIHRWSKESFVDFVDQSMYRLQPESASQSTDPHDYDATTARLTASVISIHTRLRLSISHWLVFVWYTAYCLREMRLRVSERSPGVDFVGRFVKASNADTRTGTPFAWRQIRCCLGDIQPLSTFAVQVIVVLFFIASHLISKSSTRTD